MKYIFLTLLISFICGCEHGYSYHPSEKQKLANAIRKKTALEIKNELDLIPFGTGGQMMDEIKMLYLAFQSHKHLDIKMGRKLLIASMDKFLSEINANENVRPYLISYPFKPEHIQIEIFIKNADGSPLNFDDLCVLSAKDGVLEYLSHNPNGPLFKTVYSETYEEAVMKVNDRGSIGR